MRRGNNRTFLKLCQREGSSFNTINKIDGILLAEYTILNRRPKDGHIVRISLT